MDFADPFQRLGLALAIGFLFGVERGWRSRGVEEGGRTAGLRTHALSGLLGGVAGLLGQALGGWAFAAVALPFAAGFTWFKHAEQAAEGDHSVTAVVAALLVFALGAYAAVGDGRLAAAAAVASVALLAFKATLHAWLGRLTWPELRSAILLLAMTFVALPLLPNRGFGPFDAINPNELWLLTIVLAGVSFAAYVALKLFGAAKGLVVASLAGALISSTAVTVNLARLDKQAPGATLAHVGAAILAGGVMSARIAAIAAAVSPALFARLVWPLGAFTVASAVLGFIALRWGNKDAAPEPPLPKNPFDLAEVLKFAVVLGLVTAAAKVASGLFGAQGLLPVAAIAGLVDTDAITLTVSRMTAGEGLDPRFGAFAVLLAAGVDSASKAVIAGVAGRWGFGLQFAAGTFLAAVPAAVVAWRV